MRKKIATITAVIVLAVMSPAHAELRDHNSGGGDAAIKLKLLMRQIAAERDVARAQNKKLEADTAKLKKDLKKNKDKLKSTRARLDKTTKQGKKLAKKLLETYDKLKEIYTQKRELQVSLNTTTADRDKTKGELSHCMGMNIKLYEAGVEVLKLYEKEASLKVEPVFGLTGVDIENTVQEYRFRMEDLTLDPRSVTQDKIKTSSTGQ